MNRSNFVDGGHSKVALRLRAYFICLLPPMHLDQVADDKDVMVIDSRCGEDFAAYSQGSKAEGKAGRIGPRFDACASWWTQVPPCHTTLSFC